MDGEYVELLWRNSKVAEGKVYPSRKQMHCNDIRSDCFVVNARNVLNGDVPLSCLDE